MAGRTVPRSLPGALRRAVVVALAGSIVLVACGREAPDPAGAASRGRFPATVASAKGDVVVPERPQRIVSLSPTATEILYAIGAGEQVVAVDDQSSYPERAPRTKLSGFQPNAEAVADQDPDLVVLSTDVNEIVASLGALGIPALEQPAAATLEDAYAQIRDLGAATGHVSEAETVVESMEARIAALTRSAPDRKLTYYHELDQKLFTVTSSTFIGQVYALVGLENIADAAPGADTGYPQLSAEYVIKADPDVIFLADSKCCAQSAETVRKRPGWDQIGAVRTGAIVELDDDVASRWGPRIVDLLEIVAEEVAELERAALGLALAEAAPARAGLRPARLRPSLIAVAIAALCAAMALGVLVGPVGLPAEGVLRELAYRLPLVDGASGLSEREAAILWHLRVPRVVLGGLVGAMLAMAGAAYQGAFRNPLADPYLLGVAAGAGLGVTLAIVYLKAGAWPVDPLPVAAFAGGVLGVGGTYLLGRSAGRVRGTVSLILAGVAVASFLTAAQTYVQQRNAQTVQEVYVFILGTLATAGWREVLLVGPYVAVSGVALLLHRRLLDVMALGDEEADALGIRAARVRLVVVLAATMGTAAAVSVSGLIAFVGIIVPHTIRLIWGTSYRLILPLSIAFGATFLVGADLIARTVMSPAEVPIGVVTAFFGAPFFLVVLRSTRAS